jgi:hypothetical protein
MTERNDRLLATIRKNGREEIRITRGDFKGFYVVGVQVWFQDRQGRPRLPRRARRRGHRRPSGCEGWDAMSAHGKKAAVHAETSESTIYLDRDVAGTVIIKGKARVAALGRRRSYARHTRRRPEDPPRPSPPLRSGASARHTARCGHVRDARGMVCLGDGARRVEARVAEGLPAGLGGGQGGNRALADTLARARLGRRAA